MAEMTSRERFLTTIKGEEPDRVPVAPRIAYFLLEYYGKCGWEIYMKGAKEFGWDNYIILGSPTPNVINDPLMTDYSCLGPDVKVTCTTKREGRNTIYTRDFETPAGPLRDINTQPDSGGDAGLQPNPHHTERLYKSPEDAERIAFLLPDPKTTANMDDFNRCREAIGDNGVVSMTVNSAIDHKGGVAMDIQDMMIMYYEDKELLKKYLGAIQKHAMAETQVYLDAGVEIIFGTWFFVSVSSGWSPAIYEELFLPMIKEHVDLVHAHNAIYHLYDDGASMKTIEMWCDVGVDIIATLTPPPMGDVDLQVVKDLVGKDCCLRGYIDHMNTVTFGTPETIREAVRKAISIAGPGGGFILGTCDSIRDGTPPENVHAYCKAAKEFGTYPINA